MLMSPSKGETAVHDCLCLHHMAVYMREAWGGVCVPLALSLHYFQCNWIKFNLFFINCISWHFYTYSTVHIGKIFARWHLIIIVIIIYSQGHRGGYQVLYSCMAISYVFLFFTCVIWSSWYYHVSILFCLQNWHYSQVDIYLWAHCY